MRKTIGVVNFYKSLNYGAFLQCYALQKILRQYNFDASVVNYETPSDIERYKAIQIKRPRKTLRNILSIIPFVRRRANFRKAQTRLNESDKNTKFDIAITGSDQVWNPNLSGGSLDPYFTLEKIKANKKISYAASIGNEKAVILNKSTFERLMNDIDRVSVREEQAKSALRKISKKDIKVVVDPTALLKREDWLKAISDKRIDERPYIFSYFVGVTNRQLEALAKISRRFDLGTISFSQTRQEKNIYKHCYSDGPFEFLARLRDAKLVITSSFHGTILSIILHKNFYVLMPDEKKRSRMDNILQITGLTSRIIETEADIDKVNLEDINYAEPQKKLDKLRQESLDWLKNAIEN